MENPLGRLARNSGLRVNVTGAQASHSPVAGLRDALREPLQIERLVKEVLAQRLRRRPGRPRTKSTGKPGCSRRMILASCTLPSGSLTSMIARSIVPPSRPPVRARTLRPTSHQELVATTGERTLVPVRTR